MFSIKNLLFIFLLLLITGWHCSGTPGTGKASSKSVTSPSNDSTYLVCGSIILEKNYTRTLDGSTIGEAKKPAVGRDVQETYRKGIEVTIIGKILDKKGEEKFKNFYANTDENGYFFIENVPLGEYALRGFQAYSDANENIGVFSSLGSVNDPYFRMGPLGQESFFKGTYFPYKPNNRIINLRHNVFFLSNTPMLGHQTFLEIRNQNFNFKTIKYTMLPIEQYLIDKFPENGWKQNLLASMKKNMQSVR